MNEKIVKFGVLGGIAAALTMGNLPNTRAQYDSTRLRGHNIKVVNRNNDFFTGDVYLNLEGGAAEDKPFYFSLPSDVADKFGVDRRLVTTKGVVDFLLQDELARQGGNFRIEWLPDRMGEKFYDSLRITSPGGKQVEYVHQENAIVSRVSFYDVEESRDIRQILANRKSVGDMSYDLRDEDLVEKVTIEKDSILIVGEGLHETCGNGCNNHLR